MTVYLLHEDCLHALPRLASAGVLAHAVITDPPYHLTTGKRGGSGVASVTLDNPYGRARIGAVFMGKAWDGGNVAFRPETWAAVRACMLPGAHLAAFGGTRTVHRMACAIEDAGFEIRDMLSWIYGSGFPKSLNVSRAIDEAAGAERETIGAAPYKRGRARHAYSATRRVSYDYPPQPLTAPATDAARQWQGWGTALKPAHEPIILARVPFPGTVAENVLRHGCGGLNIDACRIAAPSGATGRWPANVAHDGSDEVEEAFAMFGERTSPKPYVRSLNSKTGSDIVYGEYKKSRAGEPTKSFGDTGTASRFFYCAKATKADRAGSKHPTVKPTALMRWLVQLLAPPGGVVLDPFAGTGSTGLAAQQLGHDAVLIEQDPQSVIDIRRKLNL